MDFRANAREWASQHAALVTVATLLLVSGAIFVTIRAAGGDIERPPLGYRYMPDPDQLLPGHGQSADAGAYYFVPSTKEYFVASDELIPPIEHKGRLAVKAYFYGCGDCSEANRFVGYYEKYNEHGKQAMKQLRGGDARTMEEKMYDIAMTQRLISADGEKWLLAESPAGQEIQEALAQKCVGKGKLTYCSP